MLNWCTLWTVSVTVKVSPGSASAGDPVASTSAESAEAGVAALSAATTVTANRKGLILIGEFPSVGPLSGYHSPHRLPQNHRVEGQRPVLHVPQVQPDRLLPRQIAATADRPQPGHARA